MDRGATCIPVRLREDGIGNDGDGVRRPNISATVQRYLDRLGMGVEDLFHSRPGRAARSCIPQGERRGTAHRMAAHSATRLAGRCGRGRGGGARRVSGAGSGPPPGCSIRRRPSRVSRKAHCGRRLSQSPYPQRRTGHNMTGDDFSVTAGWGHFGIGDAVMPGQGRVVERPYTPEGAGRFGRDSCHPW